MSKQLDEINAELNALDWDPPLRVVLSRKEPRCVRCGKTRRAHCDRDEPGLDHESDCPKMHHEFKADRPAPAPRKRSV